MNMFLDNMSFFLIYICLPVAGIIAIIYLIVLLYNLNFTIKKTNDVIDDVQNKLDTLQGPVDSIASVHNSIIKLSGIISAVPGIAKLRKKKNKKEEDE
ncbi:MAG: hypothetical protein LBR40_00350 [Bacilli bacterium]|jgi:uncharacterized protein YoxC|nr:hypothetical protein [Bacilli bacterium]